MRSALFLGVVLLLSACAYNPFDPHSLRKLPPRTVDARLHLSVQDEDQIFRLVQKASNQPISSVEPGRQKGIVVVRCGEDRPFPSGDGFELQKAGERWRIVSTLLWAR